MASDTSLVFNLLAADKVSPELRKLSNSFTAFGSHVKGIALGIAGVFGGIQITGFLKESLGEYREAAKIGRLTNQVIEATGGVAGVTADHVHVLATKLQNVAGIDDDVIAGGENLLLTMTKVRNATGEGNNVFDRATTAALDMSAALGRDLNGSIMLVGRALQDPARGMNALRRSGVVFDQQQQQMITTLMESGDLLGAQKIILGGLEQKFRGAAAAAADPVQKAAVAWGNLKEVIGGVVFPLVAKFADFVLAKLVPAIGNFVELFQFGWTRGVQEGAGWVQQFGAIAHKVFGEVSHIVADYLWPAIKTTAATLHDFVGWVNKGSTGAQYFRAAAIGLTAAFVAYKIAVTAVSIVTKIAAAAQWLLNVAMYANPIGLIILAIVALVAAFAYLWTHSESFRKFFIGLWADIWGFMQAVGGWFAGPFVDFFVGAWNAIVSGFKGAVNWLIRAWNALDFSIHFHPPSWTGIPGFDTGDLIPDIPYLAGGGRVLETGVAVVHRGETVLPAGRSGGAVTVTFDFRGADSEFKRMVRKTVRVDGSGDVQVAFGN